MPTYTSNILFVLFQNYIARFGHGSAKLARQAQSKEKTLQKMMASGLTERVVSDKVGSGVVRWPKVWGLRIHQPDKCLFLFLDTVILFPTLWQDPSTCHYGAECELQVYKRWGKFKPRVCAPWGWGASSRGCGSQQEPLPILLTCVGVGAPGLTAGLPHPKT